MEATVGIIGLGLIGGSLAQAFKATAPNMKIIAYNRTKLSLDTALADKSIDVAALQIDENFSECSAIIVCLPAEYTAAVLEKLKVLTNPNTLILDAASTKANIMEMAAHAGLQDRFIGGHPMAGSEQSGYSAARTNLYENAWFVLTPFDETPKAHLERAHALVSLTGAMPLVMQADEHDRTTAFISHFPHVVASLLVNLVQDSDAKEGYMHLLAAGGFRDITRIASSSASLWRGICMSNRSHVLSAIDVAITALQEFKGQLSDNSVEQIEAFFDRARIYRDSFSQKKSGPLYRMYEITADVDDKPGIIARIATALAEHNLNIKNMGINNSREGEEGALVIRFENDQERMAGVQLLTQLGYRVTLRT